MLTSQELSQILKEVTILYVEDDLVTQEQTVETLKLFSTKILTASNGLEAYEIYKNNNNIQLIITDIQMPHKDGISLVKDIRKDNIAVPILMLTAYTDNEYLLPCVNLNIQGYIQKPMTFTQLKDSFIKIIEYLNLTTKVFININEKISYDKLEGLIVVQDSESIKLNKKEKYLMDLLCENKNKVVQYSTIERTVWQNYEESMSPSALRTLVKNLRKKVGNDNIENISGLGYKLNVI